MPGGTALTAPYRLEFDYRVVNEDHKFHAYCQVAPSADPTGYDTVPRSGKTAVGVSVAIDRVWTVMSQYYRPADASFGQVRLAVRSGTAWIPVAVYTTAVAPVGLNGYGASNELVLVFRDTSYKRLNITWLEGGAIAPYHASSYGALAALLQPLANSWGNAGGTAGNSDPYSWQLGRASTFINSWQSATVSLNRKLRRRRGLA